MSRRLRASVDPPKRPNGPVSAIKPDAEVWRRAMVLADQDYQRLVVSDASTVYVHNSRERAKAVRSGR